MLEYNYYVYIVRCSDGSYYTGVTNCVGHRVWEHNQGEDPKAYTCKRRPVELVYSVWFQYIEDAISWEKTVKRWSRKKKEAMIRDEWEKLPELAESSYAKRIRRTRAVVRRAHHDTLVRFPLR